jgi:hypothetical protein
MYSKINRDQAIEAAKLAIAVERYEWRHLWKVRLLRMATNAGGGFVFGVALGLAALIQVLHCAAGQV